MAAAAPTAFPGGRVVTLGMFIIDQFEYRDASGQLIPNHHPEQIGGGGTYAMVAARLFLPPSKVGMIVDVGSDFPPAIRTELDGYGSEMFWFRPRKDGEKTTRALNSYSGEERGSGHQSFQYLTPRCRISPSDFPGSPFAKDSPPSYIHFVCGPVRAEEILGELTALEWAGTGLVWEPMPPDCVPANLPSIREASKHMSIVSPNHLEALTLFGLTPSDTPSELKAQIERCTREMAGWLREGALAVVRSGADGVCFCARGAEEVSWLPAVFGGDEQRRVRDVTGGGNAFLGGLCAGLALAGGNAYEAILYGSVAASFAIEQSGLPHVLPSAAPDGAEVWNGSETALERLRQFRQRVEKL